MVTVRVCEPLGKEMVMETWVPFTAPVGVIGVTAASPPMHCDRSLEGQTSVLDAPAKVFPL